MEKLISFVIPCYNAEKFIGECLESIVRQTIGIDSIEVIVVDDASTDFSLNILAEYEKKYPDSIMLIALQENGGQAMARNIGMDMVTAPYLAFLDADDWVADTFCEKMLEPADRYQPDVICCGYIRVFADAESVKMIEKSGEFVEIKDVESRKRFIHEYSIFGMDCTLYRMGFLRSNKLKFKFYPKFEDNYWGMLILYNIESYYAIPEALSYYRMLENSNSHSRNDEKSFCRLQIELDKIKYFKEREIFQDYYKEIRSSFLSTFYCNTLHIIFAYFDEIPMEIIGMMQSTVRKLFPDFLEYYKENDDYALNLVLTAAFDFPKEVWMDFKERYMQNILTGEDGKLIDFFVLMYKTVFKD